mgnify:CR=1 FL=1
MGGLEEFEPQEILFKDSKRKAEIKHNSGSMQGIQMIKPINKIKRKRRFNEIEFDNG